MANTNGFYLMTRGWMENPVFGGCELCRAAAWAWLIEHAAWKATRVGVNNRIIPVGRGQLCYSLRDLGRAWKWDEGRVRRFLDRLESEEMIARDVTAGQTVITICNYDEYQLDAHRDDAAPDAEATQRQRRDDALKNEDNEINITPISPSKNSIDREFGEFYLAYPAKVAKPKAKAAFEKARKKAELPEIMAGLRRYIAEKPPDRAWAHPATWLNQERWTDGEAPGGSLPLLDSCPAPKDEESDQIVMWRVKVEGFRKTGYWSGNDGPKPGSPFCDVPPKVLQEMGYR